MIFLVVVVACFFSVLATAVMSYVSMAAPIGPWIETTIVLAASLVFRVISVFLVNYRYSTAVALVTVASGIAGIAAIACAFSFPTLYFVSPALMAQWLDKPLLFSSIMGGLVLIAGGLALAFGQFFEKKVLTDASLSFPIGQLVARMITAQNQVKQSMQMVLGAVSAFVFSFVYSVSNYVPRVITFLPSLAWWFVRIPKISLHLPVVPMLWAVGFVTGHVIAAPLLIGVIAKIAIVDISHYWWFSHLAATDMTLAFCTGMVVFGVVLGFVDLPAILLALWRRLFLSNVSPFTLLSVKDKRSWGVLGLVAIASTLFLWSFSFSFASQLYLLVLTVVWMYQVLIIAGKTGIAPLGRFATFVMLPGLAIFGYDPIQATLVATFVEISVGVIADAFFGKKMAQELSLDQSLVSKFQWLGLVVCAASIGLIFWVLITHFGLGGTVLNAQKAQARALLLNAFHFDWGAMLFGAAFAWILKCSKVNAVLVMGGILMNIDYSLLLIAGGFSTKLVTDKEEYYPFWSGVFAASSLWMVMQGVCACLWIQR